jgi:hypothetical protein
MYCAPVARVKSIAKQHPLVIWSLSRPPRLQPWTVCLCVPWLSRLHLVLPSTTIDPLVITSPRQGGRVQRLSLHCGCAPSFRCSNQPCTSLSDHPDHGMTIILKNQLACNWYVDSLFCIQLICMAVLPICSHWFFSIVRTWRPLHW